MSEVNEMPPKSDWVRCKYVEAKDGFRIINSLQDPKGIGWYFVVLGFLVVVTGMLLVFDVFGATSDGLGLTFSFGGFVILVSAAILKNTIPLVTVKHNEIRFGDGKARSRKYRIDEFELIINQYSKKKGFAIFFNKGWKLLIVKSISELVVSSNEGEKIYLRSRTRKEVKWIADVIQWKYPQVRVYECIDGKMVKEDEASLEVVGEDTN
ncbi:hypothetical protein JD969_08945 [Planctomycetota bacterium]|nr:hypothetical protein JD969_08945 [Planctomycetota bacterium]